MNKKALKNTFYASMGGILEFYDFVLFVFFTDVFSSIFFPPNDAFWAYIGVWISFGVAYLARPFGAIIFGHFGDTIGRKKVFYISLLMMVLPSFLLGLLPTYDSIGLLATILLFIIRIIQGLAVGADLSGAWVFVSEFVSKKNKSLALGFVSAATTFGLLLAGLMVLSLNHIFTKDEIIAYAWRIPFVLGGIFGIFSIFLRKTLDETPIFEKLRQNDQIIKYPLLKAIKTHKLAMLVCMMMSLVLSSGLATLTIIPKHFNALVAFSETEALLYSNIAIFIVIIGALFQGFLARFFGPFKICAIFSVIFGVLGFFVGLYNENFIIYYLLACFSQGIITFAPVFMTMVFKSELRLSGLSFAYNISYAFFVFISPFLIEFLYKQYLGYYMSFVAMICLICIVFIKNKFKGNI